MTPATIDRELRLARAAVFAAFTLNGFLLAMWVVHIPAITDRAGVSSSLLGMFVLLLAGAALIGMRVAGPAADRFGSRTLVALAATMISVTVIGPALATNPVTLAIALACFGLGNGALDVSMNTQAVHVERAYHRPIMSAFHAMFSCGGFVGALVGAATQRAGWSPQPTLTCAGIAGLVVTAVLVPHLIRHHHPETGSRPEHYDEGPTPQHQPETGSRPVHYDTGPTQHHQQETGSRPEQHDATGAQVEAENRSGNTSADDAGRQRTATTATDGGAAYTESRSRAATSPDGGRQLSATTVPDSGSANDAARGGTGESTPLTPGRSPKTQAGDRERTRKVLSLGVIAFVLLLAEGVAADWSALQVREHLGASESDAALAFGAFSATMTLGRFLADRVSAAIGPVAIVRFGSLLAAAGLGVVITSPWLPLTLVGWAMCGLGLAGGVPQIFTAAGNLGGMTAATDMSRVFTIGYLGLLAGPAVIGWLTAVIPLTAALAVPLMLTLACAAAAKVVSR
ncbi:MFS transporter [Nocardia sp. NPDC058497]|uniref:MFS transporter n=1 Tax=Nocardia sp. NPDC058497 TaxID=3346529 RepID=UPI00366050E8